MSEKKIERIAVVGAGEMGAGIGVEFSRFGYQVTLTSRHEETLERTMQRARQDLDLMVETELISANEVEGILSRMRTTTKLEDAVAGADHVVESIPESLTPKQEIFAKLDELCPAHVSLGTNSSAFTADQCIAQVKNHPERVLVTHYWRPALYIPLVEVIAGKKTDPAVTKRVAALLRSVRKRVVVQEVEIPTLSMLERTPAGWANVLQFALLQAGRYLVDMAQCPPQVVDDIIKFGPGRRWPYMPPYVYYDDLGLDWMYNASKARGEEPWGPVKERVERGEMGMKSGKGFYDWSGDKAKQFSRDFYMELIRLMKRDMEKGDL
jgi:3-hydroxybutyryl-CoA dehydrogenase